MDAVREQLNKPLIVGIAGLVVGILLGVLYAWVINPVEWTDAAIVHLRPDLKVDYMRMTIDSYARNGDVALARTRYDRLGEEAPEILGMVQENPEYLAPDTILAFRTAVEAGPPAEIEATPVAEEGGGGFVRSVLPVLCVVVLLIAGGLAAVYFLRSRGGFQTAGPPTPAQEAQEAARQAEYTDYAEVGEEPPMAQFMASYKLGDDLFDDSFSIDSPAGEFLGECGVGISETVGVGDPKKVTAFEVWLFDKNDIQTVTKVLMSAHAFLDETTRQRLAAKGEPILAETGTETVLETQTLRMVARVVDMEYGQGALPEHSFMDHLILELAVWPKEGENV